MHSDPDSRWITKRIRWLTVVSCFLGLAGCTATTTRRVIVPNQYVAAGTGLESILAAHPLASGQNISAVALGRTESCSYHLVQIRDREQPHVHATHDLVVTVLQGTGRLYVRGEPHPMKAGDVAVVPHATPHYFVNTGSKPAAAFVVFAPPYNGKDQVPVEK
jgi:mannose-6-phosphate isomerase-like protein (cupin superfamily)